MKRRSFAVLFFTLVALVAACRKPAPPPPHVVGAAVVPNPLAVGTVQTQAISMPQATTGGQPPTTRISGQSAQIGSGVSGGQISFVAGAADTGVANGNAGIVFGNATANGGHEPSTNYFSLGIFQQTAGNADVFSMGNGTDGNGTGCVGAEIASVNPISIATENNSPITLQPHGPLGQTQGQIEFIDTPGDNTASVRLTSFAEGKNPPANVGNLALPWAGASTRQDLVTERNSANTDNLALVSRVNGNLTIGSMAEDNVTHCSQSTETFQVANGGTGFQYSTTVQGVAQLGADVNSTWVEGDKAFPPSHDSWVAQVYSADTATTSQSTIATIPIAPGTLTDAVTALRMRLVARAAGGTDFATFTEDWSYLNTGGTLTAPSGSQPAATDTGHSTGAGTSIAPAFSISGSNVLLKVTPWTSSAVHWQARIEHVINAGTPAAPSIPATNLVLEVRADIQGLGNVTTWTDQSGAGHNLTLVNGGTAPVNTANAGPGGNTRAVVFSTSAWEALLTNTALIGTTNYTLHFVVQTASTAAGEYVLSYGNDSTNGLLFGINLNGNAQRDFNFTSIYSLSDGVATTNWEDWIFTCDSNGTLSLWVNGVPRPLTQNNATMGSPSAQFYIGANALGGGRWNGGIAEVDAWNVAQNNATVYAYAHGVWGL